MALINCHECGKEISDNAKICPNCGCKVKDNKNNIILVLVFATIAFIATVWFYSVYKESRKLSPEMLEWSEEFDERMERSKKERDEIMENLEEIERELEFLEEVYD